MPSLLNEEEKALDPYKILELAVGASDKDIKKAYRKFSLKYHPDKNQTEEAAVLYRKVTVSYEVLTDTAKRNYLDTRLEEDRRKKVKYEALDKKRKEMVDALNAREEEAKRAKTEQIQRRKDLAQEEEIKEAGKRMLEEAQKRAQAQAQAQNHARNQASTSTHHTSSAQAGPSRYTHANGNGISNGHPHTQSHQQSNRAPDQPPITSDDLTLILTLPSTSSSPTTSSSLESTLTQRYGPVSHLILKEPPVENGEVAVEGKKKKKGKRRAVVEFAAGNWGGCWACWKDHSSEDPSISGNADKGLGPGVKARWMKGETPVWVDWASKQDRRSTDPASPHQFNGTSQSGLHNDSSHLPNIDGSLSFASAPDFTSAGSTMDDLLARHREGRETEKAAKAREDEFESMTLLRMRQSERNRLAEQIRREEEEDD